MKNKLLINAIDRNINFIISYAMIDAYNYVGGGINTTVLSIKIALLELDIDYDFSRKNYSQFIKQDIFNQNYDPDVIINITRLSKNRQNINISDLKLIEPLLVKIEDYSY